MFSILNFLRPSQPDQDENKVITQEPPKANLTPVLAIPEPQSPLPSRSLTPVLTTMKVEVEELTEREKKVIAQRVAKEVVEAVINKTLGKIAKEEAEQKVPFEAKFPDGEEVRESVPSEYDEHYIRQQEAEDLIAEEREAAEREADEREDAARAAAEKEELACLEIEKALEREEAERERAEKIRKEEAERAAEIERQEEIRRAELDASIRAEREKNKRERAEEIRKKQESKSEILIEPRRLRSTTRKESKEEAAPIVSNSLSTMGLFNRRKRKHTHTNYHVAPTHNLRRSTRRAH